jgi:hypothetical protein
MQAEAVAVAAPMQVVATAMAPATVQVWMQVSAAAIVFKLAMTAKQLIPAAVIRMIARAVQLQGQTAVAMGAAANQQGPFAPGW